MKIGVLIPCYNCAKTIGRIISGILTQGNEVLVVNDGSEDKTGEIAKNEGAQILNHSKNRGKGAALITGFQEIVKNKNWDAVIIMDGDNQHDWHEMYKFINALEEKKADIIVGNRMSNVLSMPKIRYWTNKVTSWIISKIAKQTIYDSQCGYRLITTNVLKNLVLTTKKYDTESEILINAGRKGFSICSVSIRTIYEDGLSYIHPFKDALRFIRLVLRKIFSK